MEPCDRLRLMFFGNLRQNWAEFVLTALGLQRFETVPFTPQSRAFQSCAEVDAYLALHRLRERLDAGEQPADLHFEVPPASDNRWLATRLAQLLPRLRRWLKLPALPSDPEPAYERWDLVLPGPQSVERAVVQALRPICYVENSLITGLFGLLCWPAIFAPLPGAFFHLFHNGPADLYRDDFVARRRDAFGTCLAHLENGSYREVIQTACAPTGEPRYRMIEVKGPGD